MASKRGAKHDAPDMPRTYNNPWHLSPAECRVLDTLTEVGSDKAAAKALEISPKTVEHHMMSVRCKMGIQHRMQIVLAYDRWKRPRAT